MTKVFLSHSSKQKGYIGVIADKLGKSNIIYDAWTFESGNKTLDEIYQGIETTGIFVYFISNESLESDWVKKEINQAEGYIKNGKIKRFLPFIIDEKISHTDARLPQWIKDEYNVRYISRPNKCFDLIKQGQVLLGWDLYPKKKEADQLFIGRTSQIKEFEERIFDFNKQSPICIIVSGLPSIGRRKFIKHVLVNSNKIRPYYTPPVISLNSRNSIEDLIVILFGQGYSKMPIDTVKNLMSKSLNEKITIASTLLAELYKNNDTLFLIDNLAIVSKDGTIVDWLQPILEEIKNIKGIVFCIISRARVRSKHLIENDLLFTINIPELDVSERNALLKSLLIYSPYLLGILAFTPTYTQQFDYQLFM